MPVSVVGRSFLTDLEHPIDLCPFSTSLRSKVQNAALIRFLFFFFFQHCAFCSCSYHLSFIISRMPLANVPYSYCGLVAIIYWWLNPYHLREKIKRNPYACSFKSISGGPTYKFTHVKIILLFSVLSLCQILIQLELGPLPEALLFLNYVLLVINLRKETWFDLFVFLFFLNMFYTCDQFDNILNIS